MIDWFIPRASTYAAQIDGLILLILVLVGFWFLLTMGTFFWLIVRFRKRDGVPAQYVTGELKSQKRWISIPHMLVLVCDVFIVVGAVRVWYNVKQDLPTPAQETVRVISQQWAWTFIHPGPDGQLDTADDVATVDELHLEVDKLYHYQLESRDVLHSFSVPVFRLKQDAIPGRVITGWFQPTLTGTYDIQCAEICGIGHALMPARVVIETPEQHAAWLTSKQAPLSLAAAEIPALTAEDSKMATAAETHADGHGHHGEMSFWGRYVFSTDHKVIAMQYMFTGMFMALIGGFFAYAFRMQLAFPGADVPGWGLVTPADYNMLVTNHGAIMIFWVAMPVLIAAFGNFLIPLMLGCDDMVFPKINRLSYQVFLISAIVLLISMVVPNGGFGGAWTMYPPLSSQAQYSLTPLGSSLFVVAVGLEFVAFLLGGINFITTAMNSRAPGMKLYDIPMVVWMIVAASIMFMLSVGPLIAGAVMLVFDQTIGTAFFDPARGGDPVLWQHLFWFFGHPEVYVVLLPATGIVAEIITVFSRKKLFAYKTILYTVFGTGILSFTVWAHHQFIAGIDPRMAHIFTITTLLISVPIAEMMFVYVATLYGGSITLNTPMLWALAFIGEFLIGGVTGIFLGASGADIFFHDTYFVLAHFHYTFFPIAIIGTFAGVTYWFPKMFGRMMNDTLGRIHFWGTIIGFNGIFIPLFVLGAAGQHRRIFDYSNFPDLATPEMWTLRQIATVSMLVMLAFQPIFFFNFFKSLLSGKKAGSNPWNANTLEWQAPSPPPHGNFPEGLPNVYRGPYEYSHPDRDEDYWPQSEPA